ncbi:MAG TPA: S41 family peptidase, partial [Patescibacteria group bacterium]|nr:S41 family peptidase [Patescibacteria group bacterium]
MELPQPSIEQTGKKPKNWRKTIGLTAAAVLIFLSGVGIGDGRIMLVRSANKSEQKSLPANLDYTSVEQVYDTLKKDYDGQLDATKLLDGIKAGLATAAGDPYTEYMNKTEAKDFNNQLSGTFTGIGAELSKDAQGNVIVISPISGFPAEKAGLKPKDIIAEIDGKPATGITLNDAVSKIRGAAGTTVKLKLIRNSQPIDVEITRATITVPSVDSKVLDGNIGYIKISRFGDDTAQLATKAAQDLKQQNVKGVVLDMRSDPGGLLDAAVSVSSLWLDQGKTVLTERR